MTIYGVLSDVHGNLEALERVLAELRARRVDRVVSLGDVVGYNADSDRCARLLEAEGIASIAGNHDLIAIGALGFDRCAARPAFALRRTRETLAGPTRRILAALPRTLSCEGDTVVLFHGSPDDPTEYLIDPARRQRAAAELRRRWPPVAIGFFGHTHLPEVFAVPTDGGPPVTVAAAGAHDDRPIDLADPALLHFVNPGSVDAARRANKLAEYAVFDAGARTVALHRVPYDDARAEEKARAAGYRMNGVARLRARIDRAGRQGIRRATRALRGGGAGGPTNETP